MSLSTLDRRIASGEMMRRVALVLGMVATGLFGLLVVNVMVWWSVLR